MAKTEHIKSKVAKAFQIENFNKVVDSLKKIASLDELTQGERNFLNAAHEYLKITQRNFKKIISWAEEKELEDFIDLDIIFEYRNRVLKEMLEISVEVVIIIKKHLNPSGTEISQSYTEKETYYQKLAEIPIANNLKEAINNSTLIKQLFGDI